MNFDLKLEQDMINISNATDYKVLLLRYFSPNFTHTYIYIYIYIYI